MFKAFLNDLVKSTADTFRNGNWFWHLVFIGLTYFLVSSGFDWWYFEHTRIPLLIQIAIFAAPVGFIVPIILPLGLFAIGDSRKDLKMRSAGIAVAQAAITAIILTAAYKAFTGRFQPELILHPPVSIDISEAFHFGFLRHGIFWGWPSSHTSVAFAMSITLALLYSKNKKLLFTLTLYAFYIGLSVSMTIHWFSDFVAGAILGTIIAFVVARRYSALQIKDANHDRKFQK